MGVWVPDSNNAQGGRLYVYYSAPDAATDGSARFMLMRMSYPDRRGQMHLGLSAGYDSYWTNTYGVDAWFEPGVDTNARVAWSISHPGDATHRVVRFDPKADGISDFVQQPYNDWPVVSYALCKALQSGLSSPTVNCGPRPW